MKLILGTVQLGLDYGIIKKKPSYEESINIINYSIKNNILIFDTAQSYGNSENILSSISNNTNIRIITKLDFGKTEDYDSIKLLVKKSCINLNLNYIDTLLLHSYKDFKNINIVTNIIDLKKFGLIKNIGVSVYTVEEAIEVLKNNNFTVLQIPFNYLDNKWNNNLFQNLINERKKQGNIEIHVRSIFLQGILINDYTYWPTIKNIQLKPIYDSIELLCNKYNISKAKLAVSFIYSKKWIDGIIFGVDNIEQLQKNIDIFNNISYLNDNILTDLNNIFNDVPNELTNPVLWK